MTVVITGASRGIGKELINFFLENNAHVIALSSNPDKIKISHAKLQLVSADFMDMDAVFKAAKRVKDSTKEVNILINNAATLVSKPFSEISVSDFESTYRINVQAPFFFTQQLLDAMGLTKTAHIVNISSMGGVMGSAKFAGLSAYSSSKGALSILTECLAEELKEKNIHANCLCLGAVNTEMLKQAFPGYQAPLNPKQMADYIGNFALTGHTYFNGKVLPVSVSTP
ncbi:MAG TPA: SDR family oxidoreductase [Bacteroidia bacterium]|nr:SDR family oxidoreductase [Bacteroidia bacterium]